MKKILSLLFGILGINLVVAQSPFAEVGGQLTDRLFSGILWFGLAMIIISIIGFLMWWFLIYKRKFNIEVKMYSKRAGDRNSILFDTAAILKDRKDKSKYFSLWKAKVKLPVPDFNILQSTERGDYLEIYRAGEDRFYFLLPPKIDQKYLVRGDGKIVPIAQHATKLVDPDMAFWATKRKHLNKSMFDPENIWMKVLPYIPHIISGVLIIFILWILMGSLPEILNQLRELTNALAQSQRAEVTTGLWLSLI